jgi:hypothetical protein
MLLRNKTFCRVTLVFFSIIFASQSVEAQKIRSRSKVLESLITKAGVLKLVQIDDYDIETITSCRFTERALRVTKNLRLFYLVSVLEVSRNDG